MSSSLTSLPPELLQHIINPLSTFDFVSLWTSGDKPLILRLGQVTRLDFSLQHPSLPLILPSMVNQLSHLLELIISIPSKDMNDPIFRFEASQLPKSLTKIEIGSTYVCRQFTRPFSSGESGKHFILSTFPYLKHLELTVNEEADDLFFKSLPSSLQSLALHSHGYSQYSIKTLPPLLNTLQVSSQVQWETCEGAFKNLTDLSMTCTSFSSSSILPYHLTRLKLLLIGNTFFQIDTSVLPKTLLTLIIHCGYNSSYSLSQPISLPPSLSSLFLGYSNGGPNLELEAILLPPTMTELVIHRDAILRDPSALSRLTSLVVSGKVTIEGLDKSFSKLSHLSHLEMEPSGMRSYMDSCSSFPCLPPNLKSLKHVPSGVLDTVLSDLPSSLRTLEISNNGGLKPMDLPPKLIHLSLSSISFVDDLSNLKNIKSLTITADTDFQDLETPQWSALPNLTDLKLAWMESDPIMATHVLSLKDSCPNLTRLVCGVHEALLFLQARMSRGHAGNRYGQRFDSTMAPEPLVLPPRLLSSLPPNLTELSLRMEFLVDETEIQGLPRSITSLELSPLDPQDKLWANLNLQDSWLALLPPFLQILLIHPCPFLTSSCVSFLPKYLHKITVLSTMIEARNPKVFTPTHRNDRIEWRYDSFSDP